MVPSHHLPTVPAILALNLPNVLRSLPMSRRLAASLIALAIVLCATAAWSYYKLAGTGETMMEAANKYVATLTTDQRAKGVLAYDDKQRIEWHFIPKPDPPAA